MKANTIKLLAVTLTGAFFVERMQRRSIRTDRKHKPIATEGDYAAILPFSTIGCSTKTYFRDVRPGREIQYYDRFDGII